MKEYSILQRHGSKKPFILHNFNDVYSAIQKLFEIIEIEENRGRPYFVDNDFFKNRYSNLRDLYYLQIIEREVSEWKKYVEVEDREETNDKIVFLKDYKNGIRKI